MSSGRAVGGPAPKRCAEVYVRTSDGLKQIRAVDGIIEDYVQLRLELEAGSERAFDEARRELDAWRENLHAEWNTRYDHRTDEERDYHVAYAAFFVLGDRLTDYMDRQREVIRSTRAGRREPWAEGFETRLRSLVRDIWGPAVALWNSEMAPEDEDLFWGSVDAMQTSFVALLRFTYDWKSARRTSEYKRMIQDDREWTDLCESCVWILQRPEARALVDFGRELKDAKQTLDAELAGVAIEYALYKGGKQSLLDRPGAGAGGAGGAGGAAGNVRSAKVARVAGEAGKKKKAELTQMGHMGALLEEMRGLCVQ